MFWKLNKILEETQAFTGNQQILVIINGIIITTTNIIEI